MERTARRVPEVMVRATGASMAVVMFWPTFPTSAVWAWEGKQVALYTSDEEVLYDARDMQILAQDWQEWEMGGDARRKGATSISMILSMPAGTDPSGCVMLHWISRAKNLPIGRGCRAACRSRSSSRSPDHARRDHDGRRFHPNRDDFFRYRQRFAEKRAIVALRRMPRQRGQGGLIPNMSRSRQERFARKVRFASI
jgi:hypothetical protein